MPSPIYTLSGTKQVTRGKILYSTRNSAQCSVMAQRSGMGRGGREVQERGDKVYIELTHFVVEPKTNTTSQSNYTSIKMYIMLWHT